jgi:hypothetical protein
MSVEEWSSEEESQHNLKEKARKRVATSNLKKSSLINSPIGMCVRL